jgi:hypothetical protein
LISIRRKIGMYDLYVKFQEVLLLKLLKYLIGGGQVAIVGGGGGGGHGGGHGGRHGGGHGGQGTTVDDLQSILTSYLLLTQ